MKKICLILSLAFAMCLSLVSCKKEITKEEKMCGTYFHRTNSTVSQTVTISYRDGVLYFTSQINNGAVEEYVIEPSTEIPGYDYSVRITSSFTEYLKFADDYSYFIKLMDPQIQPERFDRVE